MVKLSERLGMVAKTVTSGGVVADVGCDHGYTSIYLVQQGIAPGCIAMDVNAGPLQRARKNIEKCHLKDKIETRLSDGLQALKEREADSILISGMGGALTVKILTEGKDVLKDVKELILQPQSEIFLVRNFLHNNHFRITEEKMVKEDGKYYVMIHAVPGEETYIVEDQQITALFYHYGKCLLEERDTVLKSFLLAEKKRLETIQYALSAGQQDASKKTKDRIEELEEEMQRLKAALSYWAAPLR